MWLSILKGVLGLADKIAEYIERKQLIDLGEARATRDGLKASMDAIDRSRRARAAGPSVGVHDDPANRDND